MAVMDGHGEFGHDVAEFVKENLPKHLAKCKNLKSETELCMRQAVQAIAAELKSGSSIDFTFSGTTLVFGIKNGNRLYVGNLGDSRCVLCRKGKKDGEFETIPLSTDNKPEQPEEKERILSKGGVVHPLPGGAEGEDCGPNRVWLADADIPGLAMSRSLGDEVAQTVGVISDPVIVQHDLTDGDLFAIWASDGVWEFISSKEAVEIVYKNGSDLDKAATALIAESDRRWQEEEDVVDDITCVIARFNH
eukprot:TRINITY_DN24342_c0_g1_i3.p1 TRINITY_DN24342_c0_g1~~TRINITY_DN24342_c0_g1_i3.p1  ORF type:complete len:248 (-),score=48.79 TRINITY_DN24342_c0_g1_i3:117-860(-)